MELGHCSGAFMTPDAMLLALQSGNAALLRLHQNETTGLVDALTVRLVGTCPPSTTLASFSLRGGNEYPPFSFNISHGLAFLGSMLGDSLLIKWDIKHRDCHVDADDYRRLQRFVKKEELLGWEIATCEKRKASAKVGSTTDIVWIIHNNMLRFRFHTRLLLHLLCVRRKTLNR